MNYFEAAKLRRVNYYSDEDKNSESRMTMTFRRFPNRTPSVSPSIILFLLVIISSSVVWNVVDAAHSDQSSPSSSSSSSASRFRKSAAVADLQSFECSDANSYLYHVLSQSKTARSLNTDGDAASSSSSSRSQQPDIPRQAINGDHLKVCSQGFTCCTEEMETRLLSESKREFQKSVQDKIVGLSHTFESRTSKFDRFFRELISNARRDLHSMFLRTYGLLYEQNSDIFAALFDNLTHYYGNGPSPSSSSNVGTSQTILSTSTAVNNNNINSNNNKVNLSRAIDSFYNTLYQRMFRILNQPYDFDARYWQCMSGQMERLKPFGDVPANMKQQVQKAFIAARTFVQGLAAGRDMIKRMMELSPSNECTSGLMRMLYCPHCRGLSNVKPCSNFCLNVMKGCLAYQADFDQSWNEYLDALLQLLVRLEGPFNIETVIDPIDVKISEAIMQFQDRGKEISDQIFTECGSPRMGPPAARHRRTRHKRESDKSEQRSAPSAANTRSRQRGGNGGGNARSRQRQQKQQQQHRQFDEFLNSGSSPLPNHHQQHFAVSPRPTTAAGTSLDRLARDLREKIQPARGFWRHLPRTMCNDEKISPAANVEATTADANDKDCWNGLAKDKYESPLAGDGPLSHLTNPEVPGSSNNSVRELLSKLRTATAAMKKAYNGQDPDWRYSASTNSGSDSTNTAQRAAPSAVGGVGQGRTDEKRGHAKQDRRNNSPTSTARSTRPRQDAIGPAIRDGSGEPFDGDGIDDTENFKPRPGSKMPAGSDDEEFPEGSGSGDGEIPIPPSKATPTVKSPSTKRPGHRKQQPTRKPPPHRGQQPDSTESIDFGEEGDSAIGGGAKTTAATYTSSEESLTFEPVTSTLDPDDTEDSEEYDPEVDGEEGWKEDDDESITNATTSTTARMETSATSTSTIPTVNTQRSDTDATTVATTVTSTTRRPTVASVATPRQPVVPSTRRTPPSTRKPPTGGSSAIVGRSPTTLFFLLAFYASLTLLWKRLILRV